MFNKENGAAYGKKGGWPKGKKYDPHKAILRQVGSVLPSQALKALLELAKAGDLKAAEIAFGYMGKLIGKTATTTDAQAMDEPPAPVGFTAKVLPNYTGT